MGKHKGWSREGEVGKMGDDEDDETREDVQMTELLNGEEVKDKTVFQKDETREWKGRGRPETRGNILTRSGD